MSTALRSSCMCTSVPLLRAGRVVCGSCGSPVVGAEASEDVYTSVRLPPDCRNADQFNRACRSRRVVGATKQGRVWTCTAEAWRTRAPAVTPSHPSLEEARAKKAAAAKEKTKKPTIANNNAGAIDVSDEVLAELGVRRVG